MKQRFLIYLVTLISFSCIAFSCTDESLQSPINIPKAITFNPNLKYDTATDIDGNIYKTISIGKHTWMAENLRVTKFRNGDKIPNLKNNWGSSGTLGFCVYGNIINKDSIAKYGMLYGYDAIIDKRDFAPVGWHIATEVEWHELTDDTLKTYRGADWYTSTEKTSLTVNNSGLTLLPSGCREPDGSFHSINEVFHTYVQGEILDIYKQKLYYMNSYAGLTSPFIFLLEGGGYSIRCVKDY